MSAPYWGQLPEPKLGQANAHLFDGMHKQARPNRASVQTSRSDAPSESTSSPFASPTASSFTAQGLAPRPASLPYGTSQYPSDLLENRRRRRSQNQEDEEDYHYEAGPTPAAAPEVRRGPPVSYKYSGGKGGQSYTYAVPPIPPRSVGLVRPEDYHDPLAGEWRKESDGSAARELDGPSWLHSPNGRPRIASGPVMHQRRASRSSQSQQTDRRVVFAARSPLQRLELTLDSMSKEAKRARVEMAEQAARERAAAVAQGADEQPETGLGSEHSRPEQRYTVRQDGPLSRNPPEARPSGPSLGNASFGKPSASTRVETAGLPDAVADNHGIDTPPSQVAKASPAGRFPVRNGSKKLKKKPPGKPRTGDRKRLDEAPANPLNEESPATATPSSRIASGPAPVDRKSLAASAEPDKQDTVPTSTAIASLLISSQGADETLLGASAAKNVVDAVSQQLHAPVSSEKVDQGSAVAQHDARLDAGSEAYRDTNHHQADMFKRRKYKPTVYGNEWKMATVGSLSGTLLDLDHEARTPEAFDGDDDNANGMYTCNNYLDGSSEPGRRDTRAPGYPVAGRRVRDKATGLTRAERIDVSHTSEKRPEAVGILARDEHAYSSSSAQEIGLSRPRSACLEEDDALIENVLVRERLLTQLALADTVTTRFKPPLYLRCGPLLKYCGIRRERVAPKYRNDVSIERVIWRGSVMIVTTDQDSSYDITPTLRLFVQPIELLPPPPSEIQEGDQLPAEYLDPIVGHPKLGRKGETLYVRPVHHLEEGKDLSRDESDLGLFERIKSPAEGELAAGAGTDTPGSFAARLKRVPIDGEKAGRFKDVSGFRLHAERGYTFWRFKIEVELRPHQQRIAYRINRGPATGFWVPAKDRSMNIMFHSCNGFSLGIDPNRFAGPDPMWRDVLNTHQSQPFHVMIGGGDQIYNDRCKNVTTLFRQWLLTRNPLQKLDAPFSRQMQDELEVFYLERYCMWFSQGLFAMANSQIPMVNMYDDHDIIDGFGSYPHHFMTCPVFAGLGNVAFKYYMLFQHQSIPSETEKDESSWILGARPGPYIQEASRSLFMFLGSDIALLAVDTRTERTDRVVVRDETWKRLMDRCYDEIVRGKTKHLLVLLGVPIAYPRLVWLENVQVHPDGRPRGAGTDKPDRLTSRLLDPVKAIGRRGMLGNVLNHLDGGAEIMDDLDDHWTAKNHKDERRVVLEDLQDLAADKSMRITILSGDVHLAAVGQFYSNPSLNLARHKDFRYIPNIISSAIVNTPPPDLLADVLNQRNKIHHLDEETDESMVPLFSRGVDDKRRNNKHLLPHRNWCSIRHYVPGHDVSTTPEYSINDLASTPSPATNSSEAASLNGLIRRLSGQNRRGLSYQGPDRARDRSRPPISSGLMRTMTERREKVADKPSGFLKRTLSGSSRIFRRRRAKARDDGGINGKWGGESGDEHLDAGGGNNSEFEDGDENRFSVAYHPARHRPLPEAGLTKRWRRAQDTPESRSVETRAGPNVNARPLYRTQTGLSVKQRKMADRLAVDLEGALDITLNVEISPRDPGGSTVPYRLLVPRLWYDYEGEDADGQAVRESEGGMKRWISLKRSKTAS